MCLLLYKVIAASLPACNLPLTRALYESMEKYSGERSKKNAPVALKTVLL